MILSPAFTPAISEGDPPIIFVIQIVSRSKRKRTPMPPNSPSIDSLTAAISFDAM